jgi:hypothetical protein
MDQPNSWSSLRADPLGQLHRVLLVAQLLDIIVAFKLSNVVWASQEHRQSLVYVLRLQAQDP